MKKAKPLLHDHLITIRVKKVGPKPQSNFPFLPPPTAPITGKFP